MQATYPGKWAEAATQRAVSLNAVSSAEAKRIDMLSNLNFKQNSETIG